MATLRRIEGNDLEAVLQEAVKNPDWYLVGDLPKQSDGPPYVLLMRDGCDALPEIDTTPGECAHKQRAGESTGMGHVTHEQCMDCGADLTPGKEVKP